MDMFSALNTGISGVQGQSTSLSSISQNISNAETVGYKETRTTFGDLVTDPAANNYSVNGSGSPNAGIALGGVASVDTQLVDVQGNISTTGQATDLAISGPGMFVVSPTAGSTTNLEYTRAGSFIPDQNGDYANAAGLYLQAWPISVTGQLPAGITQTQASVSSSTGIAALQTVNIKKLITIPVQTANVSVQANLNAASPVYPGASDTVVMDSNDATNSGIGASTIIVPTATDKIAQGDTMTISSALNPAGVIYTYGGIAFSRDITNTAVDGNSALALNQPGALGTTDALVFNPATPTSMTIPLGVNPATLGISAGTVVQLSGTTANGLNVNNITTLDGKYYVTGVTATSITVNIPSNITPPSPTSLNGATFTAPGGGSSIVNVTGAVVPAGLQVGDTVTFSNIPGIDGTLTAGVLNNPAGYVITAVNSGAGTFSFDTTVADAGVGGSSVGGATTTMFDQDGDLTAATATVSSRLFSGNIMDANTANQQLISTPGNFLVGALSFSISSGSVNSTFTYTALNPNPALGQFNSLNSLATAINSVASVNNSGLTAKVVNNQLYIADTNGNQDVTFTNGSAVGLNSSPPTPGIDWVSELGLANIAAAPAGTERFSTLQALSNDLNTSGLFTGTISNPVSSTTLKINVNNPLDTISFADGAGNTGSLLGELGLASSLNGGAFVAQTAGPFGPSYNPTVSATNMASGTVPATFAIPLTVVDSQGNNENLTAAFLKTGVNSWSVEVYAQPASDVTSAAPLVNGQVATGTATFNSDGTLNSISPSLTTMNINWTDGSTPSSIAFNWGTAGAIGVGLANGLGQFASPNQINGITQDGILANTATSVSVSASGVISVTYTGGGTRALYQIPLAEFTNPDKLNALSDNAYTVTQAAGTLTFLEPAFGSNVSLTPEALESSNVDLATQLTNMIIAQNAYQANTKLISASDQMLQNAVQMDQSISI
jgi:flagellar hook protein FlgE